MSKLNLKTLQKFLDDYLYFDKKLNIARIDPYLANGLMVKGKEEISKIGFSVSASLSLFEKAKQHNCDTIIVHHSFNHPPYNRYDEVYQNRIGYLIKNEISLFGYHFLLDAHPDIGNNVEILKTIGAKPTKPYFFRGNPWGWLGEFEDEQDFAKVEKSFREYMTKRAIVYNFGQGKVKKVVAISGKGAPYLMDMQELINDKIDLYITGEVHEWNREAFKEAKINFIAGGHYHTEKFGALALMKKIKKEFTEVEVARLEVLNEV